MGYPQNPINIKIMYLYKYNLQKIMWGGIFIYELRIK
jgi:hypothetical protein